MNSLFQNALSGIPQNIPPIWFMRQAGRYHSHYQALRKKHSFIELCTVPELAAETALGPIHDFDFDAAILFSDILFPLDILGMGLSFSEGKGPMLKWYLDNESISRLECTETPADLLMFQKKALELTREKLPSNKSLIGFIGGPFTLFAYAIEGTHSKGLSKTKESLSLFKPFCERLLPVLAESLRLQLEGSAELIMVFDTAAGELPPQLFRKLVLPGLDFLSAKAKGKIGYYAKGVNTSHYADSFFFPSKIKGIGIDSSWDLRSALLMRKEGFVQGNFEESLLTLETADFIKHLKKFIEPLKDLTPEQRCAWICGLGHGVPPSAREENVRMFIKKIREAFA